MEAIGAEGLKRHWRYLVARYSTYPVFWILAGEIPEETKLGQGPWAEVATYLRGIDPYHHPLTCHTGYARRGDAGDRPVIDFDMFGGSHDEPVAIDPNTIASMTAAYAMKPSMPALVGEVCYEGHMQQGFGDVRRRIFWSYMLSGAVGHTYGAAGIWHASVEGDPGCASSAFGGTKVYDWTTWKEGMNDPGATQLGIGKKLLEQYPRSRFEPHPEWAPGGIAAGIPAEVRFIYQPRRGIYDWEGTVVTNLDRQFDSVIDCGLFHVLSDADRLPYVAGLTHVTRQVGKLWLMCFSDQEPSDRGLRRITQDEIRLACAGGWTIESIAPTHLEPNRQSQEMFTDGGPRAWFAIIRRGS